MRIHPDHRLCNKGSLCNKPTIFKAEADWNIFVAPQQAKTLVHTSHNTYLCVRGNNSLVHRAKADNMIQSEISLRFCEGTAYGLLEAKLGTPFALSPNGPRSDTHIVKIHDQPDGSYAILDLWSRQFLSARTPIGGQGKLELRDQISDWERFRSEERVALPARLGQFYTYLPKQKITAKDILTIVSSETGRPAQRLTCALLPLLSMPEAHALGALLLEDRAICEKLQDIFENNLWINHALPFLYDIDASSPVTQQTSRRRVLDKRFDPLSLAGKQGAYEGGGFALNTLARQSIVPPKKACIVATARNEGIYLLEWVAYHRALGFEEVVIYSNNNSDNSDLILGALADAGEIIWVKNEVDPKCDAQSKAYVHALTMLPETLEHEWCAFVDIDEFICINPLLFNGLKEFLHWHDRQQVDAIAMNWVYFGSSGQVAWDDAPITQRLTVRHETADAHIKTMFRPHKAISSQPHFPREAERDALLFRGANGALHTYANSTLPSSIAKAHSDKPQESHAFVAHYFFKTCEEFLWKFSRNRGDYEVSETDVTIALEKRFLTAFLKQFENKGQQETITLNNAAFKATYQQLLKDPVIAHASSQVKSAFQKRLARVLDVYQPFLAEEMGDEGRMFLALLGKT